MMKNFVKLLLVCLGMVVGSEVSASSLQSQNMNVASAQAGLLPQHIEVIKAYIDDAKELGYSDDQIVCEFSQAIDKLEENNGVLSLSLNYNATVVKYVVGVLGVAAVIGIGYLVYHYLVKKNNQQVQKPNAQNNQVNNQPDQDRNDPVEPVVNQEPAQDQNVPVEPVVDQESVVDQNTPVEPVVNQEPAIDQNVPVDQVANQEPVVDLAPRKKVSFTIQNPRKQPFRTAKKTVNYAY